MRLEGTTALDTSATFSLGAETSSKIGKSYSFATSNPTE